MTMENATTATIGHATAGSALMAPAARTARGNVGSGFLAAYPGYATTARLDELRAAEYSYLDSGGHVYLDYAGAGLAADVQLRTHAGRVRGGCFGNPHSENPASHASSVLIEQARDAILRYFNAPADEYAVIFTPNATGACRLVGEAYPFWRQSRLVLTADNHNAVNGLREFARPLGAAVSYVGFSPADLRVTDTDISAALGYGESPGRERRRGLFAYPAQSNFSGVQHPLAWVDQAQAAGWDVLLDAAAFVPTSRLDLGVVRPEFVTVSWYKMFGYPTGIGCLLARRDALARLHRPWFSGGTVWGASVQGGFHRLADDETAFAGVRTDRTGRARDAVARVPATRGADGRRLPRTDRSAERRRRPGVARARIGHRRRGAFPGFRRTDLSRSGAQLPRAGAAVALLTGPDGVAIRTRRRCRSGPPPYAARFAIAPRHGRGRRGRQHRHRR